MVNLLVYLIVWGLVFYVCWWALGAIGLPEPFNKVATVILVLLSVLVLLGVFFGGVSLPAPHLPKW